MTHLRAVIAATIAPRETPANRHFMSAAGDAGGILLGVATADQHPIRPGGSLPDMYVPSKPLRTPWKPTSDSRQPPRA
jgi:hypothetical protein